MFLKCAVSSCRNCDATENNFLLPFSNNQLLIKIWLQKCKLPDSIPVNYLNICDEHFLPSDFEMDYKTGKRILKTSAVPSCRLDGVDVNLNEIAELQPKILKELTANIEMQKKIDEVQKNIDLLNEKIAHENKKINRKSVRVGQLKTKFSKIKINSNHKNLLSKVFSDSQINILMGRDKVLWDDDDLAMAFSLRHLSSKELYLYLKKNLNFPLPALSCVQKWAASK